MNYLMLTVTSGVIALFMIGMTILAAATQHSLEATIFTFAFMFAMQGFKVGLVGVMKQKRAEAIAKSYEEHNKALESEQDSINHED